MFYNGKPAVGIALSMKSGGNNLKLGENLKKLQDSVKADLPAGMEMNQVSDQPQIVKESISDFTETLWEAIAIVLVVSFITLGLRTGLVVAFCIPLVLTGVFCVMEIAGIDLHKVSLGALIIALGLLVDDAIVVIEAVEYEIKYNARSPREATIIAMENVQNPVIGVACVLAAVFIPVGFISGMSGILYRQFALTIAVSVPISASSL